MGPPNGSAACPGGADEADRQPQVATRSRPFLSAGGASWYYVALVDGNRRIVSRLSGRAVTLEEGLAFLRWARRRHADAQLVRELRFVEVLP